MKERILTVLMSIVCLTISADEPLSYLKVWNKNGTKRNYSLSEKSKVTFSESSLVITNKGVEESFPIDDIIRFTYENTLLGDANGDGIVNIADIVTAISYIQGHTPHLFYFQNANVNKDEIIDYDDVNAMINIIYNNENTPPIISQTVGEASYVYRNDGEFNAFFHDEIESITYSNYDKDGIYCDEIVVQEIHTQDSVYRIPITAIDSIGFTQPTPIFKENVNDLSGPLKNYIASVDGMTIKFKNDIPSDMMPTTNDKLIQLFYDNLFPDGFAGKVSMITYEGNSICVKCDSITIEEAVRKFYGVYKVKSNNNNNGLMTRGSAKNIDKELFNKEFALEEFPLHWGGETLNELWNSNNTSIGINGKFDYSAIIKPVFDIKVTFSVDEFIGLLPRYQVHLNTSYTTEKDIELAGSLNAEFKQPLIPDPKPDIPTIIPGVLFYCDFGFKISGSGEFGIGGNFKQSGLHILDFDYYPTLPTQPIFVRHSHQKQKEQSNWKYFYGDIELNVGVYLEPGFSIGNHDFIKVGFELDTGFKADINAKLSEEDWRNAEINTNFYDNSKDNCILTSNAYVGVRFICAAFDEKFKFSLGGDIDIPFGKKEAFLFPLYDHVSLSRNSGSALLKATASINRQLIIPFQTGFSLYDSNDVFIENKYYNDLYMNPNNFSSYSIGFDNAISYNKCKVYPTFQFLGKRVLASPYAEIDKDIPVHIVKFETTNSHYSKAAFPHEGKTYDFKYDTNIIVSLSENKDVEDWGYVYEDLEGDTVHISLKAYSSPFSDNRYAYYRNEPKSYATLYGYVKYVGDIQYYHGEKNNYPLIYDKKPKAVTLDVISTDETSAMVYSGFYDYLLWNGECGIEYWIDSEKHFELIYGKPQNMCTFEYINITDIPIYYLYPNTTYNYRAFIKVGDDYYRAEDIKTFSTKPIQLCPNDHHPHLIDLGLPSGKKWSCCNVGASSPTDIGNTYSWGETKPKLWHTIENYQYYNGPIPQWVNGEYINFMTPEYLNGWVHLSNNISGTQYDAATINWGEEWQMPTKEDIIELNSHTGINFYTVINGEEGILIPGHNGNKLFWRIEKRKPNTPYYDSAPINSSYALYWLGEIMEYYYEPYDMYYYSGGGALELEHGLYSEDSFGGPAPWQLGRHFGAYIRPVSK